MKLLNNTQSWRSLLSKCGVDKQMFLSDVYKKRTQAKKHQLDAPQFGRSMVEMLGVLAIIGVLSVGGIAGYSKAMFKHKVNQTLDILSHALNRLVELDDLNMKNVMIQSAEDAIKYGIMPDCVSTSGYNCLLPLKNVEFGFIYFYDPDHNQNAGGIYLPIYDDYIKTCTAILSSDLYKIYPDDWWNPISGDNRTPPGYIAVNGKKFYTKSSYETQYNTITAETIANACQNCISDDYDYDNCMITFGIRAWTL